MGSDTRMIAWACSGIHFVIANMILVLIICFLLYYEIGSAAFAGWIFFIVISGPIQGWIGKQVHKASKRYIQSSDGRVKFIGELIRGIQVTKMYCWESALLDKVFEYRQKEMKQLLIRIRYSAVLSMMNISTPHLMILIMLGVYIAQGNELTLTTTFAVITLVQLLRIGIRVIPWGIMLIVGAYVSFQRLDEFFANDEQIDMVQRIERSNHKNHEDLMEIEDDKRIVVSMMNASFVWEERKEIESDIDRNEEIEIKMEMTMDESLSVYNMGKEDYVEIKDDDIVSLSKMSHLSSKDFMLQELTLKLEKGKLYGLVGLVGSGKSSLIQAMLGEMIMIEGAFKMNDEDENAIGYVSQKAFIINATVRENILFGLDYDEEFYNECLIAAALEDDLLILVNGDMTEIGERGINLSGGQKARISFARALYRKKIINLYLLDDPLSAVCSLYFMFFPFALILNCDKW